MEPNEVITVEQAVQCEIQYLIDVKYEVIPWDVIFLLERNEDESEDD